MSTLRVDTVQSSIGVERYLAHAWVNFNGSGTVVINASGNVSSITDGGVGLYTANFGNAFTDANYALSSAGQNRASHSTRTASWNYLTAPTSTACSMSTGLGGGNAVTGPQEDLERISASFHR